MARKPKGYTKMYYAVTLDPFPKIVCHGRNKDDVAMKGLEIIARRNWERDRESRKEYMFLIVGTPAELMQRIGIVTRRILDWYFDGEEVILVK